MKKRASGAERAGNHRPYTPVDHSQSFQSEVDARDGWLILYPLWVKLITSARVLSTVML